MAHSGLLIALERIKNFIAESGDVEACYRALSDPVCCSRFNSPPITGLNKKS